MLDLNEKSLCEQHLSEKDLVQIEHQGVPLEDVENHLRHLSDPPRGIRLARPARLGDGILELDPAQWPRLEALYSEAARRGRFAKFVPASGAATRMFGPLLAAMHGETTAAEDAACRRFLDQLDHFPFAPELRRACEQQGIDLAPILAGQADPKSLFEVLLEERGLNLAHTAKALIPFHRESDGARSALEEHLVEAALHLRDAHGHCRVHFTIPQHQELIFREHFRGIEGRLEQRFGGQFDISWSVQSPATNTLAGELDGNPFRLEDGALVLRPGGHGALLQNLEGFAGDLVFVRNIDNVLPEARRAEALTWNRLLGGYLLEIETLVVDILGRLERSEHSGPWIEEALERVAHTLQRREALDLLGRPERVQQAWLIDQLDRPIRVCGVVVNSGEPGGGPFWVRGEDGNESLQIVETSQVDHQDADQLAILGQSTHFNPVHLVCRLRSHRDQAYQLRRFVDPKAIFVSRKSLHGRPLLALEHPGLWNGAMARWNTLFVAIPAAIFAPVKTVFDLLRPEHQP